VLGPAWGADTPVVAIALVSEAALVVGVVMRRHFSLLAWPRPYVGHTVEAPRLPRLSRNTVGINGAPLKGRLQRASAVPRSVEGVDCKGAEQRHDG
jgi:hypothetical protein